MGSGFCIDVVLMQPTPKYGKSLFEHLTQV